MAERLLELFRGQESKTRGVLEDDLQAFLRPLPARGGWQAMLWLFPDGAGHPLRNRKR